MKKELLEKFKKGQCSPEELQIVLEWLRSDEAENTLSGEIGKLWEEDFTQESSFVEKEEIYERILEAIAQESSLYSVKQPKLVVEQEERHVLKNAYRNYRGIAAILLILIVAGGAFFWMKTKPFHSDPSFISSEKEEAIKWVEQQSLKGQKLTIHLPDGTVVKMNSGSKIKYPESFTGNKRIVWFEGEGFFNVTKDPNKPFIIRSGDISTTVLGTSFNIRAFPEDDEYEIAVVTGKVQVGSNESGSRTEEVTLIPKEIAVYKKSTRQLKQLEQKDLNLTAKLGWKDGILMFDNADLNDVFHELENWYGVEIEVRSRKEYRHGFTGSYKDENIQTVLEGIGYVMDFDFEIKGKKVIIK